MKTRTMPLIADRNPADMIPGSMYLDNNFWMIPEKQARKLCGEWGLPRVGYQRFVTVGGFQARVQRTVHEGNLVWAVMMTSRQAV